MIKQGAIHRLKHDITHRGVSAWALFLLLLAFYFLLYFPDKFEEGARAFGASKETVASMKSLGNSLNIFEHFMRWLGGALGYEVKKWWDPVFNKWTLYGTLYTLAIAIGGAFVIRRYRHNPYQVVRTSVVMVVQIVFGFSLPILLGANGYKDYYFSYFWPLKIEYLYPENLANMPIFLALYGILGAMLLVPIMGAFFGKRWYCSWVCGCGGLANTFGEPWRQLSNKGSAAWRFEKFSIHSMIIVAFLTTGIVIASYLVKDSPSLDRTAAMLKFLYGVFGVALLSGAVGVAFYPIKGTRVWCRYFCPMAGILGLVQKFGRYRITVKKDMCISCGMCSKYCEMGIDVRAYAQRNQSFTRASCVGCGICAEVCPRGVLRLENKLDPDPQELTMNAFLSETYKYEPERKAV